MGWMKGDLIRIEKGCDKDKGIYIKRVSSDGERRKGGILCVDDDYMQANFLSPGLAQSALVYHINHLLSNKGAAKPPTYALVRMGFIGYLGRHVVAGSDIGSLPVARVPWAPASMIGIDVAASA